MEGIDKQAILKSVFEQYQLYWSGIHGVEHWARVMRNGLLLADQLRADRKVVTLFALFHAPAGSMTAMILSTANVAQP